MSCCIEILVPIITDSSFMINVPQVYFDRHENSVQVHSASGELTIESSYCAGI